MERHEEQRLIEDAATGCKDSAAALIRAHQRSLYAYLLRLSGKPDLAEDIAQEAFVRVLGNLHRFDNRFRFSTWLFTIARRLLVNAGQKMRPAYDTDAISGTPARPNDPGAPIADAESGLRTRDELQRALLRVSAEQREVLVLFHQLDWPIALIAEQLQMPEGTVKSHLHRGRRRLRDLLESSTSIDPSLTGRRETR